ncbi:MAG: hypothetical protein Q9227_000762 [Pyrenula ochraceoflavens]
MVFRITSWNVNGIRFDILEADIVVFQETKIQRKDLTDSLVVVDGWDCYWSLPRHKKGYSGVVVYTRNQTCAPIRAEEGICGVLCPPNSSKPFKELPSDVQIGGYPTIDQLTQSKLDASEIDSEGRCVILEFPAFVLLGVYAPANRDESRDDFRLGFLNLLDARVRNLIALGKRVILTGDINIARDIKDAAWAGVSMQKNSLTVEEFMNGDARRLFNHLIEGGKVNGQRDEDREEPVLYDICRAFHPNRAGMYTCWEQKVNARPGNHGARIDYVLSSLDMKQWFADANIQEGLMGSDHCPVYAVFKDKVPMAEGKVHIRDILNPAGTFRNGERRVPWSPKFILPMSGRLIPEFDLDRRRSIKDMFTKKPTASSVEPASRDFGDLGKLAEEGTEVQKISFAATEALDVSTALQSIPTASKSTKDLGKRKQDASTLVASNAKRGKTSNGPPSRPANDPPHLKGQKSLKGFFTPKAISTGSEVLEQNNELVSTVPNEDDPLPTFKKTSTPPASQSTDAPPPTPPPPSIAAKMQDSPSSFSSSPTKLAPNPSFGNSSPAKTVAAWSSLFTKPVAPRCEHDEPCKTMQTKKAGANKGRSFWMCARPLGPSGQKERNSQWRCGTFIWCSDYMPNGIGGGGTALSRKPSDISELSQ